MNTVDLLRLMLWFVIGYVIASLVLRIGWRRLLAPVVRLLMATVLRNKRVRFHVVTTTDGILAIFRSKEGVYIGVCDTSSPSHDSTACALAHAYMDFRCGNLPAVETMILLIKSLSSGMSYFYDVPLGALARFGKNELQAFGVAMVQAARITPVPTEIPQRAVEVTKELGFPTG
jgi:hypothetical protein